MESVRTIPQIRGGKPVPENNAGPVQAFHASGGARFSPAAQQNSALPVKLLALALLTQVFVDAPGSGYYYFHLLPRFVFAGVLFKAICVRSSGPGHSRRVSRSASILMILFGIVVTISWISREMILEPSSHFAG